MAALKSLRTFVDEEYVVVQRNFSTVLVMDVIVCVHKCVFVCVQVTQQLTAHADIKKKATTNCAWKMQTLNDLCVIRAMPCQLC